MLIEEKKLQPEADLDLSTSNLAEQLDLLQREAITTNTSVLVLVDGWESSGKGYLITRLRRELDPRYYHVRLFDEEIENSNGYPWQRKIWEELPKKGHFSIFDRSYYSHLFEMRHLSGKELKKEITPWLVQENVLSQDNICIVKLFLDVSKETQKNNIEGLEKDPYADFLVSERDHTENRNYESYRKHMDAVLSLSDNECCPWTVISMEDRRTGTKKAMDTVIRMVREKIDEAKENQTHCPPITDLHRAKLSDTPPDLLSLDMTPDLSKEEYDRIIEPLQIEAKNLAYEMFTKSKSLMIAFEGTDAAGKGGAIKRLTKHIDPRSYRIHTTAAPSEEERAYNYMHRFITKLPSKRQIKIFDRSWYGRVLVERVEGFATPKEWERAYDEINALEHSWMRDNICLVKFYLAIDKDEQRRRFEDRSDNPLKQYKLTDEDWRNREKWDLYEQAAHEMFQRTSTKYAPWILIPGNSKNYARVEVLKHVIQAMKESLKIA